jgi:hypothetical protein
MLKRLLLLVLGLLSLSLAQAESKVLIVADEFPAMQILAKALEPGESDTQFQCSIVSQDDMPEVLEAFYAVIVYIHGGLKPGPEQAFIRYAREGGRLVLLHHSISSGKRKNRDWFDFLQVELPLGNVREGGYQWREGVPLQIYRVANHYITTHQVDWPQSLAAKEGERRPAATLEDSEVYLNHVLRGSQVRLLGLRYPHPDTGKTYIQETAGWYKRTDRGWLFYFMPGHSEKEFESPVYRQILLNTLLWKPDPA